MENLPHHFAGENFSTAYYSSSPTAYYFTRMSLRRNIPLTRKGRLFQVYFTRSSTGIKISGMRLPIYETAKQGHNYILLLAAVCSQGRSAQFLAILTEIQNHWTFPGEASRELWKKLEKPISRPNLMYTIDEKTITESNKEEIAFETRWKLKKSLTEWFGTDIFKYQDCRFDISQLSRLILSCVGWCHPEPSSGLSPISSLLLAMLSEMQYHLKDRPKSVFHYSEVFSGFKQFYSSVANLKQQVLRKSHHNAQLRVIFYFYFFEICRQWPDVSRQFSALYNWESETPLNGIWRNCQQIFLESVHPDFLAALKKSFDNIIRSGLTHWSNIFDDMGERSNNDEDEDLEPETVPPAHAEFLCTLMTGFGIQKRMPWAIRQMERLVFNDNVYVPVYSQDKPLEEEIHEAYIRSCYSTEPPVAAKSSSCFFRSGWSQAALWKSALEMLPCTPDGWKSNEWLLALAHAAMRPEYKPYPWRNHSKVVEWLWKIERNKLPCDAGIAEKLVFRYYVLLYLKKNNLKIFHWNFNSLLKKMWNSFILPQNCGRGASRMKEIFTRPRVRCLIECIYYAINEIGGMPLAKSFQTRRLSLRSWNTIMMEFRRRQICVATFTDYLEQVGLNLHEGNPPTSESMALSTNEIEGPAQHWDVGLSGE
eukprot:Gregarina_sp_Poly_1__2526@NODE_1684_length_3537_cov_11_973199_g1107_i0_p1_GENE_NODE_1684_length_3537_cov_11_973199_g1107_i0NODE_1684_length_3537_cov_11_973199_g1107_i0_p1_ORF_typecomplete_len649_score71_93_NODE_1684_length_3537_cov_11_973199_g1107_i013943340